MGQAGQGGGDHHQRRQGQPGDLHPLGIEEVGQEQEVAQEDHGQPVARAPHLKQLEGEKQDQQGDARILAEKVAICQKHADRSGNHQQVQQPAWRQGGAAPP
jgi:hypothetical protein